MSEGGETIFSKIIRREIPADIVYQDDEVTAFRDIRPAAPTHILVVPNRPVPQVSAFGAADAPLIGRLILVATELARREGIDRSGYRLIINNGPDAGQEVYHVHVHLIGGRPLGPMVQRG